MNSLHILLIDDRSWIREVLRGHLLRRRSGISIREMDSSQVARLERKPVTGADLIFLAGRLDHADALATLRAIRSSSPRVPVVVVNELADEESIVKAIRAGAADVISHSQLDERAVRSVVREAVRGGRREPDSNESENCADLADHVDLPGYEVRSRLASSALSTVYLARSRQDGQDVAVKRLRGLGVASGAESLRRFLREHAVLAALRHDHIVRILDFCETANDVYITMEYLPGGTLRTLLDKGAVDESRAVTLIEQILKALTAIHDAGILHRDLKPANVMLRADGQACLIDFGLARQLYVEQEITLPGRIYGTPYYMSPEQGQGLETDRRSDLYSLGVVFYELLTGAKPYVAGTPVALVFKHAHAPLPVLPDHLRHWQDCLERLMAKEPGDRPATAAAVLKLLNLCKNR